MVGPGQTAIGGRIMSYSFSLLYGIQKRTHKSIILMAWFHVEGRVLFFCIHHSLPLLCS